MLHYCGHINVEAGVFMAKLKFLIKKILRTICIWWVLAGLLISANALLLTSDQPQHYILGSYTDDSETLNLSMKQYPSDWDGDIIFNYNEYDWGSEVAFYSFWVSRLYTNTYYTWGIPVDPLGQNIETGNLYDTSTQKIQLVLDTGLYVDTTQINTLINNVTIDKESYVLQLPQEYYSMFYDATSKMLWCVMYLPDHYMTGMEAYMQHVYIMSSLGNLVPTDAFTMIYGQTEINADGLYSNQLNEIISKLESMAAGGGLTQEEVNEAIEDALAAHDEQLRDEGQSKLDQLIEQISSVTDPYRQAVDQITGTLENVSNIFAYSGTDAIITFPAAVNPLANNAVLWEAQEIDIGAAYTALPSSLRILLQYALRAAVLLAALHEVINIIKYAIIGRGE